MTATGFRVQDVGEHTLKQNSKLCTVYCEAFEWYDLPYPRGSYLPISEYFWASSVLETLLAATLRPSEICWNPCERKRAQGETFYEQQRETATTI